MKKCPYCAKEIRDEAVICRYCGRDLAKPRRRGIPAFASLPVQADLEPSLLTTLLISLLIVILVDFGLFYAVLNWNGAYSDWKFRFAGLTILFRVLVGYIAVREFKPENPKPIHYITMILLAFIPVGDWLPAYLAGKGMARRVSSRLALLVILLIGAALISIYVISKTGFELAFIQDMPKATLTPTLTPSPTGVPATATPEAVAATQMARPTATATPACLPFEALQSLKVGEAVCLSGTVAKISQGFQEVEKNKGGETVTDRIAADFCLVYYPSGAKAASFKAFPCQDNRLGGYDLKQQQAEACLNLRGKVASAGKLGNGLEVEKIEPCK